MLCVDDFHITQSSCHYRASPSSKHQQVPLYLQMPYIPYCHHTFSSHFPMSVCACEDLPLHCALLTCLLCSVQNSPIPGVITGPLGRGAQGEALLFCNRCLIIHPARHSTSLLALGWKSLSPSSQLESHYLTQQEQTGGQSVSGALRDDANRTRSHVVSWQHVCF